MRANNSSQWCRGLFLRSGTLILLTTMELNSSLYVALFEIKPRLGLKGRVPAKFLKNIENGIDEEVLRNLLEMPIEEIQRDF